MEFLADHCFFVCGVEFFRRGGHDVIRASEVGLARASDEALIPFCRQANRILLTLDRDFTNRARFPLGRHVGIVFFRLVPFAPAALLRLLETVVARDVLGRAQDALVLVSSTRILLIRPGRLAETL